MRATRIARFATVVLVAGMGSQPLPAMADGFGWYARFFEYPRLQREYRDFFRQRLNPDGTGDTDPAFRGSAFRLLSLMEQSRRVPLVAPTMHDGELLGAEALREFGRALEKRDPESPARFFITGRQFLSPENMPACRETHWIHGACGSAIVYPPDEVSRLFFDLNQLVAARVHWTRPEMQEELLRLRNLVQEAALKNQAIFFYGHD